MQQAAVRCPAGRPDVGMSREEFDGIEVGHPVRYRRTGMAGKVVDFRRSAMPPYGAAYKHVEAKCKMADGSIRWYYPYELELDASGKLYD